MWKIEYSNITNNIKDEYLKFIGLKPNINNTKKEIEKIQNRYEKLKQGWKQLKDQIITNCKQPTNSITKHPEYYALSIDELLLADFSTLVKLYLDYISLIPRDEYENITNKKEKNQNPLITDGLKVFNYSAYSAKIANFFKYYSKELKITSCFYCDSAYINTLPKTFNKITTISNEKKRINSVNNSYRFFDVDHIIPKAQCPILALCLYNFVPSCKVCNSIIKGSKDFQEFYDIKDLSLDDKKEILSKLSPSSPKYEYDSNVKICVLPNKQENKQWYPTFDFYHNPEFYKIYFDHKDPDYKKVTEAFYLEERYNYGEHLAEALNLLDLQKRYTKSNIKYIKNILCAKGTTITEEQIEEDIFHKTMNKETGRIFTKMKNDLLE